MVHLGLVEGWAVEEGVVEEPVMVVGSVKEVEVALGVGLEMGEDAGVDVGVVGGVGKAVMEVDEAGVVVVVARVVVVASGLGVAMAWVVSAGEGLAEERVVGLEALGDSSEVWEGTGERGEKEVGKVVAAAWGAAVVSAEEAAPAAVAGWEAVD